jgi:MFS family permease
MSFRDMKREMLVVFLLLSFVSFFADVTYEGARSVFGSYAEVLGATALCASLASIGEFLGYVTRLASGVVVARSRSSVGYWLMVFTGYALNLVAVPLLAFAGYWQLAVVLMFFERIGKGLRTPARDTILAEVTEEVGRGKAFGLHEALDQAGAVLGPLMVSASLYLSGNSYATTFSLLAVPATISMILLYMAFRRYPTLKAVENPLPWGKSTLPKIFWLYVVASSIMALGFIHWVNVSYYLKAENLLPDPLIALMYLVAMLVDGIMAFPIGLLYDKIGPSSLLIAPISSALIAPFLLTKDFTFAVASSALWGVVMGVYESISRAFVADITPPEGRAFGYGVFGAFFGFSWMLGSMTYGYLYQYCPDYMTWFSAVCNASAFACLAAITLKTGRRRS